MAVLFVNTPTPEQPLVRDMAGGLGFDGGSGGVVLPPLDLAYMAATVLGRDEEARIIDADVEEVSAAEILALVEAEDFRAVVATVSLPALDKDCEFLAAVKERTQGLVLASTGIAHPPVLREILEKSHADLALYGECDTTILEIITHDDRAGTARLEDGELVVEPNRFEQDLDSLPIPARTLLPKGRYRYHLLGEDVTTMQTTRGCPYSCGYFCPYPLVQGKKWRSRSPEHVVREIEDIVENHGIHRILFRDATFTLDLQRVHEICDRVLEKGLRIEWWCETRVDCLDRELLEKMKAAGCKGINIGVETGDEEVMTTLAKKGLTVDRLKTIRDAAREIGLGLHFLLMIGLPKETRKSIHETKQLLTTLRPDSIGVCIITPYPGTPLHQEAEEKGWIEVDNWTQYGGHAPIMHTDNLSTEELEHAHKLLTGAFRYSGVRGVLNDLRFRRWASAGQQVQA